MDGAWVVGFQWLTDDELTVGAQSQVEHSSPCLETGPLRAGIRVPHSHRAVIGRCDKDACVRRQDGIIHDAGTYSGSPMSVDRYSREIIGKYGYAVGPEVTMIPTAATQSSIVS